jgi:uncharacterized protein (TIGR03083 family)
MTLELEEYGDGIGAAWTVLREHAARGGADRAVPTCPGWTVRDLVAHQGTVHRWAAASVRGAQVDVGALEREGLEVADQVQWLDDGAKDLLQAIVDAPEDLDRPFFLLDAPPARLAWARRQCHETTIHAVDAMSASLGRPPRPEETWVRPRLAADGVDELLTGFVPRPGHRLRADAPQTVVLEAADTGDAWTMRVSLDPVVVSRGRGPGADTTVRGAAVELYLGLWNRGPLHEEGRPFIGQWREQLNITWR